MLETLEDILRRLGARMLDWRRQGLTEGRWEGTQLKAWADAQAHGFLVEELSRHFPGIVIVSEEDESTHAGGRPHEYWLIDPIDGTASFCGGFDGFVTQAALMRDARPVLGVVHAPAMDLTYAAVAGGPAWCNGRVLGAPRPVRAPILIDNYPQPRGVAAELHSGLPCGGYVESGSLGLKICRVADGTADLFVKDVIVRDWDLAPGQLVLESAGGTLAAFDGAPIPYSGGFARHGVVAAADAALARRVEGWRRSQTGAPLNGIDAENFD